MPTPDEVMEFESQRRRMHFKNQHALIVRRKGNVLEIKAFAARRRADPSRVYQGHARFKSPTEVSVDAERLTADRTFINVGGRAVVPQMPGIEGVPYLTNSSIVDVDIETASHLAQHEDEDVSTAIRGILEHEGIDVRANATCIGFSRRGEDNIAHVECSSGDPEVSGSHVLLAVGRRPNTDDLGLTGAGVVVDKRGYIVVDDHSHTTVPGIRALGDCNGKAHSPTRRSTMLKLSARIFWTMTRAKSAIALPLMLCILTLRSADRASRRQKSAKAAATF